MSPNQAEILDSFSARIAEADLKEQRGEYRLAIPIWTAISGDLSSKADEASSPEDSFCRGMAHFYAARLYRAAFLQAKQERAPISELASISESLVEQIRVAIDRLTEIGDADNLASGYFLLIHGFIHAIESHLDLESMPILRDGLLEAVRNYRRLAPAEMERKSLAGLLAMQSDAAAAPEQSAR